MKKNTEGSTRYLAMLQQRVDTAAEVKVEQLNKTLEKNGKALEAIRESQEETIPALAFFKVILSGVITFNLLDRITGDWTVMDITWMKSFVNNIVRGNYMIWFFISIVAWGIVTVAVIKITKNMTWYDRGMTEVKISMKEKIHSEKLRLLLAIKSNISEERHYEESREIITVTYDEPNPQSWGRSPPTISLEFDEKNQFMLQIVIRYNSRKAKKDEVLSIAQVKERVLSGLIHQRIFLNKADDVKGK